MNTDVQNFGDAFYFTVVAISTVGFGDIVPVSEAGRLVTVAMIISGIILEDSEKPIKSQYINTMNTI